jgi:hypothetical protein
MGVGGGIGLKVGRGVAAATGELVVGRGGDASPVPPPVRLVRNPRPVTSTAAAITT